MPAKYDFKDTDITPDNLRTMTDKQLTDICAFILTKSVDMVILQDMISDRNNFRNCYYALREQIQALGVEPCIDYFKNGAMKGRPQKNV